MSGGEPVVLRGEARRPGEETASAVVTLEPAVFSVAVGDGAPWHAAYRDIATVAVDRETALVALGAGEDQERWLFERFGSNLGALARGLRDGRLRQWLTDGLVEIAEDAPVESEEYAIGDETGVAQLLYHRRGVALAPLDERFPPRRIRRADIQTVSVVPERGGVHVRTTTDTIELLRLGTVAASHAQRWTGLRDDAAADAAAIVAGLVPDAPIAIRRTATSILREGHPADAAALGDAWSPLEQAALVEPAFAESYGELVRRAGGASASRWLAIAPEDPGAPDRPKLWFLVGMPGNLIALELVSAGAHATYLFRVAPRPSYRSDAEDPAALERAVREISEALIDARFLREPMALSEERLTEAPFLRYRLALAALPSLAAARARFVARLVHRDPTVWGAALDDLIAWHGSARDEGTEWPGRAAQEVQIDEAQAGHGPPQG